jgi:hypothetical protein
MKVIILVIIVFRFTLYVRVVFRRKFSFMEVIVLLLGRFMGGVMLLRLFCFCFWFFSFIFLIVILLLIPGGRRICRFLLS